MDNFAQQAAGYFTRFFILTIERFFDQFFADAVPELALVGRVHFPGRLLDADAFLVNGFYQDVGHILAVPTGNAVEREFIDFTYKCRAVFAEPVDRPVFHALDDARIYIDVFFHGLRWTAYGGRRALFHVF